MALEFLSKFRKQTETDVCLIVEGCYPYVPGGVSSWIDWMMRNQPDLTFEVVAIMPNDIEREIRFSFPENMVGFHNLYLHEFGGRKTIKRDVDGLAETLANLLTSLFENGRREDFVAIDQLINDPRDPISLRVLMDTALSWKILQLMYDYMMPQASFHHYFWAWRALLGGMFAAMKFNPPKARAYHTISTGYAGLVAARASYITGRPALITEHGIYTNERHIEIVMADWIAETVEKGLSIDDKRFDLRAMWIRAFQTYAQVCYQSCSEITTLYEDNQRLQLALGAEKQKLTVIANGIDFSRFAHLDRVADDAPPTIALIGRVVPIKDIKTFIAAGHLARLEVPGLKILVMGPTDEDPDYFDECTQLVEELGMQDCLKFTGSVNLVDYMSKIHVMVLTSLSEAQPLVLLEAGSSGIPCVTSDVGSCREIIEGRSDESPNLGRGGIVTDLVAPDQVATSVVSLLKDPNMRRQYGVNLCQRVEKYYLSEMASDAYSTFYRNHCGQPDLVQDVA